MDEVMESTAGRQTTGRDITRDIPPRQAEGPDTQEQLAETARENFPEEESFTQEDILAEDAPSYTKENRDYSREEIPFVYQDQAGLAYRANRGRVIKAAMDTDLARIRRQYPHVNSLEEAGPLYRALRFNRYAPMSPRQAWRRAVSVAGQKPPSTGSMAATAGPKREFFTAGELDRLTREDLKDEAVYKKAMKSLLRL